MILIALLVLAVVFVVGEVFFDNVERCGPVRRPRDPERALTLAPLPLRRL